MSKYHRKTMSMFCRFFTQKFVQLNVCSKNIITCSTLPTENDLYEIESNILLRQQKNNVPIIRKIIKDLKDFGPDNNTLQQQLQEEMNKLPNRTHKRLLAYGNEPFELKRYGSTLKNSEAVKEFSDLCKKFNIFRMDHLGNFSGHKSYFLIGNLAELEQGLIRLTINMLQANNFKLMSVPDILPSQVIEGCGMQTDGERTQVYKLDTGMCLSGTSEMALAGYFSNRVLKMKDLPIKVAAVSRCFRAETSGLQEEKGIYRVHQFTKVEMFSICTETQSEDILESFKKLEILIFDRLGLCFRLLDMSPNELGAPAYQKYDIEAWMPGRQIFGEISSCSNCTDYQAKRLNIKYQGKDGQIKYAHTVNGTATAIPRLLIALVESHQNKDGAIVLPKTLNGYMRNEEIRKNKRLPELKLVKHIRSI